VRGAGGLDCGAGDLVGALEKEKVLGEVILERGVITGQVETVDEEVERRLDVVHGEQRPTERDDGGEDCVDDAERSDLCGAVVEVGGGAAAAEAGSVRVVVGEGRVEAADDTGVLR
jgi:hypothetical protein